MNEYGKKIIDISGIIGLFEAKEGEVEHIIGKTGQGKTYEATRRALSYLKQGYVVYTTWRLNIPDVFDERQNFFTVLKNTILFRKNFFRFNYKENWKYVNLDDYLDKDGIMDTEKLSRFLATRTDCIFFMDEGQDVFDSHKKSGQIARQSITRTRHMHKTLIIVSQRAQAVDVTARGNVTYFYKCVRTKFLFFPAKFKVYMTDEIDEGNNYPIWARHDSQGKKTWSAPLYHSAWQKQYIFDAYDSWYMRKNMIRSQDLHLDAYTLSFRDKLKALYSLIRKKKEKEVQEKSIKLSTVLPIDKPRKKKQKMVSLKIQHI